MGAEQSSSLLDSNHGLSTSFGNSTSHNPDGSSSLPPSPQRSLLNFSRGLSREVSKSITVSSFDTSGGSAAQQSSASRLGRTDSSSTATLTSSRPHRKSPSMSRLNRSSGIVVVCPGPMRRMRSTGSLDSATHQSGRMEAGSRELRKLRQIPMFEPLIAQSATSLSDAPAGQPDSSIGRCIEVPLSRVTPEQLAALVKVYGDYVQHRANVAHQRQTQVLGLQNKVDYETRRLWSDLQARENGTPLASPTTPISPRLASSPSSSDASSPSADRSRMSTYAGRAQVDAVVLQTSQISGLIDQCSAMVERLRETVAQLKQAVPKPVDVGMESAS